ncbi:hypothetical protein YC2023_072353 [Brassica napus]
MAVTRRNSVPLSTFVSGQKMTVNQVCVCSHFPCVCGNMTCNSRANTCNKPRLLEGMHLLDKRSMRALPVALMIHNNSTDRMALVLAMHHSNFYPINF